MEDRIHWLGAVDDPRPWYRAAWVLVLASESESFGRVLVEAMGSGTPVIATTVGGIPEIVRDGQEGLLFSPGSSEQLANAIKKLLKEESLRMRLAQAAFRRADSFGLDLHIQNMLRSSMRCADMLKGMIRHGLCSVVFFSGTFHLARFLSDRIERTAAILCFHRVVEGNPDFCSSWGTQVDLSRFKHQMRVLSRLFSIVPFSHLVDQINRRKLGPQSLALTFDDGFRDSYTNVFKVLKEYGLPALFFVSPTMIGSSKLLWQNEPWYLLNRLKQMKPFHWGGREWDLTAKSQREELNTLIRKSLFQANQIQREDMLAKLRNELGSGFPSSTGERRMLSAGEITEMKKSGLVELGAHAMTHAPLSKCTEEELEYEIRQSKDDLEPIWSQTVTFFAYPFGDYTDNVVASLKKNGYTAAVTLDNGLVTAGDDLHLLKRISVVRDDTAPSILVMKILPMYLKRIINHIKDTFYGYQKG